MFCLRVGDVQLKVARLIATKISLSQGRLVHDFAKTLNVQLHAWSLTLTGTVLSPISDWMSIT